MRFYKRTAKVVVGDATDGLVIEHLRIDFNVEKSLSISPQLAEITVYNLKRDNEEQMLNRRKKVRLYAGYDDEQHLIFEGAIRNVSARTDGLNRTVKMVCDDSRPELTESKTWSDGTGIDLIISDLLEMSGLEAWESLIDKELGAKADGYTFNGDPKEALKLFGEKHGFDVFIDDGVIMALQEDKVVEGHEKPIVSSSTGLIGRVEKTDRGYTATSLLNYRIRIGGELQLVSNSLSEDGQNDVEGSFKVSRLTHSGSTKSGNFHTKFDLVDTKALGVENG